MEGSKEYFLRMREEDFNNLTPENRSLFTYVEMREQNEYEVHKEDERYLALKRKASKASKDVQVYLFNKRNK